MSHRRKQKHRKIVKQKSEATDLPKVRLGNQEATMYPANQKIRRALHHPLVPTARDPEELTGWARLYHDIFEKEEK